MGNMEKMTLDDAIKHLDDILQSGRKWNCQECKNEHVQLRGWLKELKTYKDLEKQGKLHIFPCRVRDTVYVRLPGDNHFTVAEINKIEIKPSVYGGICYFIEPVSQRGSLYRYFKDDFGKTVFFTLEEAEAALKGTGK